MAGRLNLFFWAFLVLLSNPAKSQFDELFFSGFKGIGVASNLSLNGVAQIQGNGILQLTNETQRQLGHAFYSNPIQFKNSTDGKAFSFSTAFAFAMVPEYAKLGGHGLAFTISPTKEIPGALPSQYLGLVNSTDNGNITNHIFAVEFDTVQDFEFADINDNHVGIDINSLVSNKSATAAYFDGTNSSSQVLDLKSGQVIQAWIKYDSQSNQLDVRLSPSSIKPRSTLLSVQVDLSLILQESMYVGFSSSTGLLSSSHYIMGWSFKMNGDAKSLYLDQLPSLPSGSNVNNHTGLIVGVSVSATLVIILVIGSAFYLIRKIKNADVIEAWELDIGPHRFTYKELKKATRGFRDKELIGFEAVCGRRPIEPKALPEELMLVDWVWEKWRLGAILEVVDSRLGGEFDELEAVVLLKLGLMCSNNAPKARPPMRQAVRYLDGEVPLPETVLAPDAYDGKKGGGVGGSEFEDYVNSYMTSSNYEKVTTWSSVGDDRDPDIEAGSASPLHDTR
ncbi:hypothetical protein CMV_005579 [Castanea mollissima]|uniref:non-specific serine/threonine protein kinase n=1 Tax=Castanea mollissima TaxID=60419 RepID=A0A8J4W1J5_9ROSI|nr:hypothetical protein CMV_005579 [Castanea mollissima]